MAIKESYSIAKAVVVLNNPPQNSLKSRKIRKTKLNLPVCECILQSPPVNERRKNKPRTTTGVVFVGNTRNIEFFKFGRAENVGPFP